jgi:glucokinase-like ROK family protein
MGRQYRTGDHSLVRTINLSVVLNCLRERAPLSRAQLAAVTGLNKTTVSSLVSQLLENQFVREIGYGPSVSGRPGVLLELDPDAGSIIGLEIGVDFILLVLTDFKAHVLWRWEERTVDNQQSDRAIARVGEVIDRALDRSQEQGLPVLGMGVGVPGLVDVSSGTVLFAPNLHWRGVPIRDRLQERCNIRVLVDNDANTAALGEKYFGIARDSDIFIYLGAGVGLGGGVFIGEQLYRGHNGYAGEVGHMTVVEEGELCNCGNRGCWETLVSQTAVLNRVERALRDGQSCCLPPDGQPRSTPITIAEVFQAAQAGDPVARNALHDTGRYLGVGIANLVNIFNPDLVILGGILSGGGDILLPAIKSVLRERAFHAQYDRVDVKISTYGFDACVMGGAALVLHDILSQSSLAAQFD